MTSFISFFCMMGKQYEFDGWRFELHEVFGPALIDDNDDPINADPPEEFWSAFEAFQALSEAEQEDCLLHSGGCIEFAELDDVSQGAEDASEVTDWIAVEDRLPDPETDARLSSPLVLIAFKRAASEPGHAPYTDVAMATYDLRRELWRMAMYTGVVLRVTHWMPLPEAPKQGCRNE